MQVSKGAQKPVPKQKASVYGNPHALSHHPTLFISRRLQRRGQASTDADRSASCNPGTTARRTHHTHPQSVQEASR